MRRILPLIVFALVASTALLAAPPEICRVQGGNTRTIWGTGFNPGQTQVLGWNAPYDVIGIKAALAGNSYVGRDLLPAQPPSSAVNCKIIDSDPNGRVIAVNAAQFSPWESYFDALIGPEVIWVKNSDGFSKAWPVRAAQPWFVYPEKANAGQQIRIFGRNIVAKMVAIKPKSGGDPIFIDQLQGGRNAIYEAAVTLPNDLKPGDYSVYVHNGTCGTAGWGGPIDLTIQAKRKPSINVLNVKSYGAKGNGIDDDTEAIRSALVKAGASGGGIVYVPTGRYAISKTLWVPSGVTLKGDGMHSSTLCVTDDRPMTYDMPADILAKVPYWLNRSSTQNNAAPMVWMWDNTDVTDLGFDDGPGVLYAVFAMHDNCHIIRCSMHCPATISYAAIVEFGSYGFTMKDCDIEAGAGALFMVHGPHEQAYVGGNKVRCTRPGMENNIFIRSFDRSIVENNFASDADRNFVSQAGHASGYHSILLGNTWYNNIPRRHNSGENMYESGNSFWHGKIASATANTITVPNTPFERGPFVDTKAKEEAYATMNETFVLIVDGKGLGQYRKVVSYTPSTLTLEKPWDIVPDSSTYITIGRAFVETLWVDNTEEHTANWTGWWGNCWGNVIDGQIIRDGEGIYLWAYDSSAPSPVAFNDVIGSKVIGRGQIKFVGPLVFGNTVRSTEITDFRYKPSFHGSVPWMADSFDPNNRFGIDFGDSKHTITTLPSTAPLKDWNIVETSNIYDGPKGIQVAPDANHNIIKHNVVNVDGEKIRDESPTTVTGP
jgi:hypothetical protein